jgi:hypothetical protein
MPDLLKTELTKEQASTDLPTASSNSWWRERRFIVAIIAFVLLAGASVLAGNAYRENWENFWPEDSVFPSSFNKKPSGLLGLLKIMEKANLSAQQWMLPYRLLSGRNKILLIVYPSASLTKAEVEQIMRWVKQGNRLIYLDEFDYAPSREILKALRLSAFDGQKVENKIMPLASELPEASHAQGITVSATTRLRGGQPLLKDGSGNILVRTGRDRIVVGTCPDLVSNFRLQNKDDWSNFQFLVNLCRQSGSTVLIDEKCHGFSSADNVYSFLGKRAAGLVFFQVLLILLLAAYGASFRFGRLISTERLGSVSTLDFIDGLASTYKRAKANALACRILFNASKQNWCKLTGTSVQDSDEALVEKWIALAAAHAVGTPGQATATHSEAAQASVPDLPDSARASPGSSGLDRWRHEASEFLVEAQAAGRGNISNAQVLELVQKMQLIDKRLKEVVQQTEG